MFGKIKNLGWSFGKTALIVLVAIFGLFVLLSFLRFGFVYWIYSTVEDWTTVRLGFDYYVSNLIATVFASLFSLLTPMLAWYIFLGKKQAWGIGTIVGIQVLMCVSIYTIGSGVCFDRKTGKPLCYYADTPQGRVWSYTPGFDPVSNKAFQLYTREIKEAEERQKNSFKTAESQSRPSPVQSPSVKEYSTPPVPSPKKEISDTSKIYVPITDAPRIQRFQKTEKPVAETLSRSQNENSEKDSETLKIRQAEETRRQQILEQTRLEEAENNRRIIEQQRLEREQKDEQERAERKNREDEKLRREETKRKKLETFKTIINIAQPVVERLTRRKN